MIVCPRRMPGSQASVIRRPDNVQQTRGIQKEYQNRPAISAQNKIFESNARGGGQAIRPPTLVPARVYAITRDEATTSMDVITGKILITDNPAYVLIDQGATYSFISK